jgi:hypothetical protein
MMGQPAFSQLYQGRDEHQLFVGSIPAPAGELLLLAVFGEDTTIGLVRALFRELVEGLRMRNWPSLTSSQELENLEAELAEGLVRVGAGGRVAHTPNGR